MTQVYDRHKIVPVEVVLPLILSTQKPPQEERTLLEGVRTHVNGVRLFTFKEKGLVCVSCGIQGVFFALERSIRRGEMIFPDDVRPYHLNLYAIKEENGVKSEVLMTYDHILARALGGTDNINNTQPMCSPCNNLKSHLETKQVNQIRFDAKTAKNRARKVRKLRLIAFMKQRAAEQKQEPVPMVQSS